MAVVIGDCKETSDQDDMHDNLLHPCHQLLPQAEQPKWPVVCFVPIWQFFAGGPSRISDVTDPRWRCLGVPYSCKRSDVPSFRSSGARALERVKDRECRVSPVTNP